MIHISNISKHYGPKVLYKNASLQLNNGEKVGLVGPNGNGKTTLFRLILSEEKPDEGSISKPEKCVIGYFSQKIEEMKGRSVIEEVKSAAGRVSEIQKHLLDYETKLSEPMDDETMALLLEKYGDLQSEFEALGGYDLDVRSAEILTGLGIVPEDHHRDTSTFSGGWKMRIALAKILVLNPDVLLMDEPTNHLDLESIIWLEDWIRNYKGALLMTSHDRYFMNRLVTKILEVANKTITTYSGNYDFYEKEREIRKEQLAAAARRQDDMLAKEEEFIAKFAARASHAAQVQSRVKKLEKIERIEIPKEEQSIQFEWPKSPRGGNDAVKIENVKKTWVLPDGKERLVFSGANALVRRLDRVAVVGVNGAGKSTLLKIIAGHTQATEGSLTIGASTEIGYFSQNALDVLSPQSTVLEELQSSLPQAGLGYLRNLLGALKFSGDDVDKKISILSGGEKSRVVLAKILARPTNLLILDEPTNHLDIASREVLLQAIKDYDGTVMIVSHDRHFLKEFTTKVFELDKNHLKIFDGNWDYYLEKKQKT